MISVALGYFFAGATKIAASGIGWANGYTLQGIMLEYRSPWSDLFADRVLVCRFLQVGLLLVQTSFPVALFVPVLRWFYVPSAILFHLVAMQTMATHAFLSLWFLLVAFVPVERVPGFLDRNVSSGPIGRRLLVGGAILGFGWIPVPLYFEHRPKALMLLFVPVLWTALLGLLPQLRATVRFDSGSAAARRAVAWLDAFDASGRLSFERVEGAAEALSLRTARGDEATGATAARRAAWRVPLGPVLLPLVARGLRCAAAVRRRSAGSPRPRGR